MKKTNQNWWEKIQENEQMLGEIDKKSIISKIPVLNKKFKILNNNFEYF